MQDARYWILDAGFRFSATNQTGQLANRLNGLNPAKRDFTSDCRMRCSAGSTDSTDTIHKTYWGRLWTTLTERRQVLNLKN